MENRQLNSAYQSFSLPNVNMKVVSFRRYMKVKRPKAIFVIAMCQLSIWVIILGLNIADYMQFSLTETLIHTSFLKKTFLAFTHVFSEYSFIWLSTFSLLGFIGLMNMKSWGWVIALITNSLYFSLITTTYIQKNIIEASINKYLLIFLLLFIGISSIYLWIKRFTFWKK